jgi:replicative DNA helicase
MPRLAVAEPHNYRDMSKLFSFESEGELIGSAMYMPEACDVALDILCPEHFADPVHAVIWRAIGDIVRGGGRPAPAIVRDRVGAHPDFERWGGYPALFQLFDQASPGGIAGHVAAVADRAGRRALVEVFDDLGPRLFNTADSDATELLSELERRAGEIAQQGGTADNWVSAGDMIRSAIDHAKSRAGTIQFPFGTAAVDRFTNGLNAGEVTLVGARTGMGKTVAGMAIAHANAAQGNAACFFSLEMTAQHLGMRLACDIAFRRDALWFAGVSSNPTLDRALKNELDAHQWEMLEEAQQIAARLPLHVDDQSSLTMAQIEARARRRIRKFERAGARPGPIIIDHLGKVRPSKDRKGSRHAEIADISGDASDMAKRLGVPVVCLVQLNRQVESRGEDKRPVLTDLRQAGELEEDARQVVFLFRPEYYLRDAPPGETFDEEAARREKLREVERKLFWIVEKNSHGPRGQVQTYCDIGSSAIRDWDL